MSRARKLADCDRWAGPWQLSNNLQWIRPYYCNQLGEYISRYGPTVLSYVPFGKTRKTVLVSKRKQRDASVEA